MTKHSDFNEMPVLVPQRAAPSGIQIHRGFRKVDGPSPALLTEAC